MSYDCTRVFSCFSHLQLFAAPLTVVHQSPLSMEFSRKEYWSGLPYPSPGDLLDPVIEAGSPALQADSLPLCRMGSPRIDVVWGNKKMPIRIVNLKKKKNCTGWYIADFENVQISCFFKRKTGGCTHRNCEVHNKVLLIIFSQESIINSKEKKPGAASC